MIIHSENTKPRAVNTHSTPLSDPITATRSLRSFDRLALSPEFMTIPRTAVSINRPKLPAPASPPVNHAPEPKRKSSSRGIFFRCVRLLLAAGLLTAAAFYAQFTLTNVASDQAYISAEIISVRAPIAGQVSFQPVAPGAVVSSGTTLFHLENPRFGNQEVMTQLNWIKELVERLQVETDEAIVRHKQQEQIFRHHEALFKEQLISRLAYLDEETKFALALTARTNKQAQLHQALARAREVERQVDLQKEATVTMPVDGVVWNLPQQNGGHVPPGETVMQIIDPKRIWVDALFAEKHADKLQVGTQVAIRTRDGKQSWTGRVESIRGGTGRVAQESIATAGFGEFARRRVAVRVKMESAKPFDAAEFYGVGRSVIVSLNSHE
jgi:membrane fusion protein, multidrug efflux system